MATNRLRMIHVNLLILNASVDFVLSTNRLDETLYVKVASVKEFLKLKFLPLVITFFIPLTHKSHGAS